MTYKETRQLICDCLALSINPRLLFQLKHKLKSKQINWTRVVSLASKHYVLITLYQILKKFELHQFLPSDLVVYLEDLSSWNATRNKHLLIQLKEINCLLNKHHIVPIFLKGSAHIISNLYHTSCERMIGDIDFIVPEIDVIKTVNLLLLNGYISTTDPNIYNFQLARHYPRLISADKIFAVEVHKSIIKNINTKHINYDTIVKQSKVINAFRIPSIDHLLLHNMINTQINDEAYCYGDINLRQQYDFLLLSDLHDLASTVNAGSFVRNEFLAYVHKTEGLFSKQLITKSDQNITLKYIVATRQLFGKYMPNLIMFLTQTLYLSITSYRYVRKLCEIIMSKNKINKSYLKLRQVGYLKAVISRLFNRSYVDI